MTPDKVTEEDILKAKEAYGIRTDIAGAYTEFDRDRFMKIAKAVSKACAEGRNQGIEMSAELLSCCQPQYPLKEGELCACWGCMVKKVILNLKSDTDKEKGSK